LIVETYITTKDVSLDEIVGELKNKTSKFGGGAIVCFIGYVKEFVDGREVYELEYSAYEPYATHKLEEIAREEGAKNNVLAVKIIHRVGRLKPGESTIYIIVASRSRREAFETASRILERVKHEVPIFKLEKRSDGEYWVIGDKRRVKRIRG